VVGLSLNPAIEVVNILFASVVFGKEAFGDTSVIS